MTIAFSFYPLLFGSHYLQCHKLGTKRGEKNVLKKTLLSQPFSGLVTLDKHDPFLWGFFFQKDSIHYDNQGGTDSMAANMSTC